MKIWKRFNKVTWKLTTWGYFLVAIYVEEQPLYKYNLCFNIFWMCHVQDKMQCYHNNKNMHKANTTTRRDVLNVNMKITFLVCQHIIRTKFHTTNNDSRLIMSSFLEKIVRRFSEIVRQITYSHTVFHI